MGPAIVVFPDCFTALGGNQYVNSSAIGNYADYLTKEIVPFVDREFRTLASREHRGCFGKSSGGYGAIIHGMQLRRRPGARSRITRATRTSTSSTGTTGRTRSTSSRSTAPRTAQAGPLRRAAGWRRGADRGLRRRPRAPLPRRGVEEAQALDGRGPLHHEPVHGRDLRSRSARAQRLSPALQPRDRRGAARALEALAGATIR